MRTLDALRAGSEAALKQERMRILICAGTGCVSSGSLEIHSALKEKLETRGIPCSVELEAEPHGETVGLKKCGCHGFCEMGPLIRIEP